MARFVATDHPRQGNGRFANKPASMVTAAARGSLVHQAGVLALDANDTLTPSPAVLSLMPAHLAGYYAATEAKHFGPSPVGSVFNDPLAADLVSLLELVEAQRGGLDGDDRDDLVALGADPDAFAPPGSGIRYLLGRAWGRVGVIKASALPAETRVEAVRTKPGAPCSLVVSASVERPVTDVATLIVGPDAEAGHEVLFTAHPGLPTKPASEDRFEEGAVMTTGEVMGLLGDVLLQLR
jgi:hypothetical protein